MLRKTILLILAIAVLPVFAQAPKVEESVRKFVQEFYSWYVPIAMKENDGPAFEIAIKQKPDVFSPKLLNALKEDSAAQAKSPEDIVGIDWDPFLNSQDPRRSL